MYQSKTSLPERLDAREYTTGDASNRDIELLRERAWQLVGTTSQIPRDGDYFTVDRLGVPVLIRRDEGTVRAFHNVCAHRGCRLATGPGNSDQIKCPYHGWRYGYDGKTRKIPDAKQFPNFQRDQYQLRTYPVRQIGQLLLIHLGRDDHSDDALETEKSVDKWSDWEHSFHERTAPERWRLVLSQQIDYDCDWKIPIEGSLESYHLEEVHSGTFGAGPNEADCDHRIMDSGTIFETVTRDHSLLSRLESAVVRKVTGSFEPTYRHLHVFPNIMSSMTDSMTLVYQIFPLGLRRSRMCIFGFAPRSRRLGWLGAYLAWCLGKAAAWMAKKVLQEDAAIFPEVQAGLDAAITPRIFGRIEERIHAFQTHWLDSMT